MVPKILKYLHMLAGEPVVVSVAIVYVPYALQVACFGALFDAAASCVRWEYEEPFEVAEMKTIADVGIVESLLPFWKAINQQIAQKRAFLSGPCVQVRTARIVLEK